MEITKEHVRIGDNDSGALIADIILSVGEVAASTTGPIAIIKVGLGAGLPAYMVYYLAMLAMIIPLLHLIVRKGRRKE